MDVLIKFRFIDENIIFTPLRSLIDRIETPRRRRLPRIESESWEFFLIERSKKVSLKDILRDRHTFDSDLAEARYYFGHVHTYTYICLFTYVSGVTSVFHVALKHASFRTRLTAFWRHASRKNSLFAHKIQQSGSDTVPSG